MPDRTALDSDPLAVYRYGAGAWSGGSVSASIGDRIARMRVKELAGYIKSWNPFEASLGLAAINSALNSSESVDKLLGCPAAQRQNISTFSCYVEKLKGRKVAVVGRFPDLGTLQ